VKQRILDALESSRAGYGELRLRRIWRTAVLVRDRVAESAHAGVETGGFARCCSTGTGWGSVGWSGESRLEEQLLQAHELSLAGSSRQPLQLAEIPIREFESPASLPADPRSFDMVARRERAESLGVALREADRRIAASRVLVSDEVVETWYGTSEGTWIHHLRSSVTVAALAVARQEGSAERAMGSVTCPGGWHSTAAAESLVQSVAARAVDRLHAPPVRSGRYPVVLDPAAAGALMHRAVSHIARPALPGADPDVLPLGARLGPDILTVGDDPTAPGLSAGSPYDDEGAVARRCVIVQNGVVLGHLHNRETAGASSQATTGHARAGSIQGPPYPRASNTFVAPGVGSLDDLMEEVGTGIYVMDALACEATEAGVALRAGAAHMIRNGRIAEPVKGVKLSGELLDLLGRVDVVGGDFQWSGATARCRDGAAGLVTVTTGAPHLRLREVLIESEVG